MKRLFILLLFLSVAGPVTFAQADANPYTNPWPNFWWAYSKTRKQNEAIIRKLDQRLQMDSAMICSVAAENREIKDSLASITGKVDYLIANKDSGSGILYTVLALSLVVIAFLSVFAVIVSKRLGILQSMLVGIDTPVATPPNDEPLRIESYNDAVFRFTKINDHIADLLKRTTKPLMLLAFQYLATQTVDKETFVQKIKESDIDADDKIQFTAVADSIENFLAKDRQVIDRWLKSTGSSYQAAIRMPLGQIYDSELDQDVLLGDCEGKTVTMVNKLGYHFPGNSIKPFREKSLVTVL